MKKTFNPVRAKHVLNDGRFKKGMTPWNKGKRYRVKLHRKGDSICKNCGKKFYSGAASTKRITQFCNSKCFRSFFASTIGTLECFYCKRKLQLPEYMVKKRKFCSLKCRTLYYTGKNHPCWKGGKTRDRDGYEIRNLNINKGGKPFFVRTHRWIMEKYLGRPLLKTEVVHHINHNPKDNHIPNLMVVTREEHNEIHKGKKYF